MIRSSIESRLVEAIIALIGVALLISFFFVLKGNATNGNSPPGDFFLEEGGNVVMEAEHFTGSVAGSGSAASHDWQSTTAFTGYTGDSAVQALPNSGVNTFLNANGPALQYDIYFQTPGTYYVYVRGEADSAPVPTDNDSVHAGLDGTAVTTLRGSGLDQFSASVFNWRNDSNGTRDTSLTIPTPGYYTFYLWMREDGVVVDKIWLSLTQNAVNNGDTSPGPDESVITDEMPTPTPSPTPPVQGLFLEQGGSVVMEAEHFTDTAAGSGAAELHSWEATTAFGNYSGESALQALPNSGVDTGLDTFGPALLYDIAFQTPGTYYVYVRGRSTAPYRMENDSIHAGLNGTAVTNLSGGGLTGYIASAFNWQNHSNGAQDTTINIPTPGVYTFYLWMREDGTVVDKIWLTTTQDAIGNGSTDPGPDEAPVLEGTPTPTPTNTPEPTSTGTITPTPEVTPTPTSTPMPDRDWQQATTTTSPPAVSEYALTYDQLRQRVVLYGGNETGWPYENSTWEFDGIDWSQINATQTPTAVYGMAMVYDPIQGVTILFGGSDANDAVLDETWQYDGVNWTQLSPAAAPPARAGHAMTYDAANNRILLFGGDGAAAYNDTWAFDGATWSLLSATTPPPARVNHAVAYLSGDNNLLLFGGLDSDGNALADTWLLNLNTNAWTQVGSGPTARQGHALVYDPLTMNSVLVGGVDSGDALLGDTWHYHTGSGWTAAVPITIPTAGAFQTAVYDTVNQRLILLINGETWLYQ